MSANTVLNMIRVKGSHCQLGQQIGEACAPLINRMLKVYRAMFEDAYDEVQLAWDEAILQPNSICSHSEPDRPPEDHRLTHHRPDRARDAGMLGKPLHGYSRDVQVGGLSGWIFTMRRGAEQKAEA